MAAHQLDEWQDWPPYEAAAWPVFDGTKHRRGHVLKRGLIGYESFSKDNDSLGTFISLGEAAKAVLAHLSGSSSST
jgi:hypothetical protein